MMSLFKPALAVAVAAFVGAIILAVLKAKVPAVGKFLP